MQDPILNPTPAKKYYVMLASAEVNYDRRFGGCEATGGVRSYVGTNLLAVVQQSVIYDYPGFAYETIHSPKQNENITYFAELYKGALEQIPLQLYRLPEHSGSKWREELRQTDRYGGAIVAVGGERLWSVAADDDERQVTMEDRIIQDCVDRDVALVRYESLAAFRHHYGI